MECLLQVHQPPGPYLTAFGCLLQAAKMSGISENWASIDVDVAESCTNNVDMYTWLVVWNLFDIPIYWE